MHYYQFNIADYQSHTRHLSLIEDICYRRMLDWQYLHEKPLPIEIEKTARLLLLNECLTDVERVLNEFFILTDNGWINVRAISEIDSYNEKINKASIAGKASAAKRKQGIKQTLNERSTTVQPNNNHKPLTNNHNKYTPPLPKELINEWMQHRKKKPITERVIKTIEIEANKLGWSLQQAIECCCANSWQGFKAEWVNKNQYHKDRSSVVNAAFGNLLKQYEVTEKDITNESITF